MMLSWLDKLAAVGIAMVWLAAGSDRVDAAEYRLGAQEKLRLRVIEWYADEAQYRELEAIGGEYIIGPTGAISVPMIGEVQASGLTAAELTALISERLQAQLGRRDLNASMELVEFRPIYVVGDVGKPGDTRSGRI